MVEHCSRGFQITLRLEELGCKDKVHVAGGGIRPAFFHTFME